MMNRVTLPKSGEKTNGEMIEGIVRRDGYRDVAAIYQEPYQEFYFRRAGIAHLEEQGLDVRRIEVSHWEKARETLDPRTLVYFLPHITLDTGRTYRSIKKRGLASSPGSPILSPRRHGGWLIPMHQSGSG